MIDRKNKCKVYSRR